MRLGNLSGNKTTIQNPVITLGDSERFILSAMAMAMLGLEEGNRVDFYFDNNTEALYVAKVTNKTEGRAISKLGKAQHAAIHSFLADNEQGINAVWEIQEETIVVDEIVWNKIVLSAPSVDVVEPTAEEVANATEEDTDVVHETTQAQAEENAETISDDF